jgi:short-subunit dehydrogenase
MEYTNDNPQIPAHRRDGVDGPIGGGRYALITGASSGIGEGLLHQFAKNGFHVIAVAQDEAALRKTVEAHRPLHPGVEILPIAKDLMQEGAPQELYDEIKARGIEIEVLVNDAGQGQFGQFTEIPIERDIELIRLNIEALTRLTKLYLPEMVARNRGRILNVGSVAGFQPGPMLAVYHATKAFVVSLCEALSEELKDTEVTVTCLCPGPTETNFFDRAGMQDTRVVRYKDQMMMNANDVAEAGFEATMNGERVIIPGMMNKIMTFSRRVMPVALQAKSQKQFYETSEEEQQAS